MVTRKTRRKIFKKKSVDEFRAGNLPENHFSQVQACFVIRQLSLDNATTLAHAEFREQAKTSSMENWHTQLVFFFFCSPSMNGTSRNICLSISTVFEINRFLEANNTSRKAA